MKDDDGDLARGTTARLESLERIRSSQFIESQSLERSLAATLRTLDVTHTLHVSVVANVANWSASFPTIMRYVKVYYPIVSRPRVYK